MFARKAEGKRREMRTLLNYFGPHGTSEIVVSINDLSLPLSLSPSRSPNSGRIFRECFVHKLFLQRPRTGHAICQGFFFVGSETLNVLENIYDSSNFDNFENIPVDFRSLEFLAHSEPKAEYRQR